MQTTILYILFAIAATVANIASQDFSLRVYDGPFYITVSVFIGTAVGLVLKYVLDKRYIFKYYAKSLAQNTKTFTLYTFTGIFTTAIFWGLEFGFEWIFSDKLMRYLGGIIGLAIGYFIKYHLDKRFIFTQDAAT